MSGPTRSIRDTSLTDPFLKFAKSGIRPGLSRIRGLLDVMGHPEHSFKSILVTGSNGKGTTCAVLASCLQQLGWNTGLFTSPHLISVRERFRVNGGCAPISAMQRFLRLHGAACRREGATYFETTTAFALWWFQESGVERAVLEIGLGGRHDACNAVDGELSVVTSIALEHTQWLGRTQAQIAAEKGCVARPGKPTLAGPMSREAERSLRNTITRLGGTLVRVGHEIRLHELESSMRGSKFGMTCLGHSVALSTRLLGRKAVLNAGLAASAALHLVSDETGKSRVRGWKRSLQRGVRAAQWPARLEVISGRPIMVLDVAHNAAAVASLVEDWRNLWPGRCPVILVGLLDDKPARVIGSLFSRMASQVVVTRPDSGRAVDPQHLARYWQRDFDLIEVVPDPGKAWEQASRLAGRQGCVLVTGSHFVVGPVMRHLGMDPTRIRLGPIPEQ